jgi:hypothetical protein
VSKEPGAVQLLANGVCEFGAVDIKIFKFAQNANCEVDFARLDKSS